MPVRYPLNCCVGKLKVIVCIFTYSPLNVMEFISDRFCIFVNQSTERAFCSIYLDVGDIRLRRHQQTTMPTTWNCSYPECEFTCQLGESDAVNMVTINIHAAAHGVAKQDAAAHTVQKPWNWDAKIPVITLAQQKKGTTSKKRSTAR